ncbi:MAG: hypothetical protein QOD96_7475 [Pseudonocardiales bacterium]|nr:hypothetical protein [Pseudonocardiales bacterium]
MRNLWQRLEQQGVPTLQSHTHGLHHPHLSYVVLLQWELDPVRVAVEQLDDHQPFELTFDAVAAFRRGRVSLVPSVPADLVARQHAVVAATRATGAMVHMHYEINRWLPHASLATRASAEQLVRVTATAYDVLPLTATVTRAALIDSANGQFWALRNLPVEEAGAKKLRCISIDEIRPLSGLAGGQSDAAGHPRM